MCICVLATRCECTSQDSVSRISLDSVHIGRVNDLLGGFCAVLLRVVANTHRRQEQILTCTSLPLYVGFICTKVELLTILSKNDEELSTKRIRSPQQMQVT